jgi:acetyltransferase-like isoleucine patch superfamily enzyme
MNKISKNAKIGKNVKIGEFVIIHDNVIIGDNSVIGPFCELGISNGREKGPLIIGDNSLIRSHSIFYQGTQIGSNLVTGHFTVIRENAKIGQGLQLGIQSVIQGECEIGDHVKLFSVVNIPKTARIGDFVWIFSYTVLTNDPHPPSEGFLKGPTVKDYAVIGSNCTILPGITVGSESLVGAGCVLNKDLPDKMIGIGNPAKVIGPVSKIKLSGTNLPAYPWRYHFHRGYPNSVVKKWLIEKGDN